MKKKEYIESHPLDWPQGYKNHVTCSIAKIKITKKNGKIKFGNGFLLKLKSKRKNEFKALISSGQVIKRKMILNNWPIQIETVGRKEITKIILNDKQRKIVSFDKNMENITIVEILDNELPESLFFEMDENYLNKEKNFYLNHRILIYQFPGEGKIKDNNENMVDIQSKNIYYSDGIITDIYEGNTNIGKIEENFEFRFIHNVSTLKCSSGCPVILCSEPLDVKNPKIIGIHVGQCKNDKNKRNYGTFLGHILEKINKLQKIKIEVDVKVEDINKEVYFLGGEYDSKKEKYKSAFTELKNSIMYIDGIKNEDKKYRNFFKFPMAKKYIIEFDFQEEIKSTKNMFNGCKNITNIEFIDVITENVHRMDCMFADCHNLKTIKFPTSFKTNNVDNMSFMFSGCVSLTSLNLKSFITDNVNDMSFMFRECINLISVDFPASFKTDKVKDMSGMFSHCEKLKSINLDSFRTDNVVDMSCMFNHCNSLLSLNLKSFKIDKVTDMNNMFCGCVNLKSINFPRSLKSDNIDDVSDMFKSCSSLKNIILPEDANTSILKAFAKIK